MESIYTDLSNINFESHDLIVPLSDRAGKFLISFEGKYYLILAWEDLQYFSPARVSHKEMLRRISEFHFRVRDFRWPSAEHKTFGGWIERGVRGEERRYGSSFPATKLLNQFTKHRFPQLQFHMGNIHLDIHEHNICFNKQGRMKLLDFDEAQPGALFWDLVRVTAMYVATDFPAGKYDILKGLIDELVSFASDVGDRVNEYDVRCLLVRIALGPLQDPSFSSSEAVPRLMRNLERALIG